MLIEVCQWGSMCVALCIPIACDMIDIRITIGWVEWLKMLISIDFKHTHTHTVKTWSSKLNDRHGDIYILATCLLAVILIHKFNYNVDSNYFGGSKAVMEIQTSLNTDMHTYRKIFHWAVSYTMLHDDHICI